MRWVAAACCWMLAGVSALAEVAVSAQFSQDVVSVGETVQLQVKVTGSRSAGEPPAVAKVDGLQISYAGPSQSTNVQIVNGQMKSETSVTYVYQVEATRAGQFTIPAIQVAVEGRRLETRPVALKAQDGSGREAPGQTAALGTLEVVLPKKTAYVGEMVPLEIRLAVDSRIRWQPEAMPEIPGEGFTKQKLPEPRRERETKDGREHDVVVFRTAITPSKAGRITLGPVEVPYLAQVPRAQKRNRGRSLFDLFDDNVFGDPFFSVNQRYKARAEAVELEVTPLPAAGRPPNFSGAVGEFKFTGTGAPNRVKIGDPITMKLSVSGRGNFDRMAAPALVDHAGWRTYPASGDFKTDDDLGISGTKTFSVAVIPEAVKTEMPAFEFVYFDPAAEKYVTLTGEPERLVVEGTAPLPATPAPVQSGRAEAPAPAPARDILGIRYDAGGGRRSFEPLYRQRGFLLAQTIPLAALLALGFFKWRKSNFERELRAVWNRERSAAVAKLRGGGLEDSQFLELAAGVIQKEVALLSNRSPASVDAAVACGSRLLAEDTAEGIEMIFNARAEALYAGTNGQTERLSNEQRLAMLTTLENFERSPRRA